MTPFVNRLSQLGATYSRWRVLLFLDLCVHLQRAFVHLAQLVMCACFQLDVAKIQLTVTTVV
jgi:hypothetical protein